MLVFDPGRLLLEKLPELRTWCSIRSSSEWNIYSIFNKLFQTCIQSHWWVIKHIMFVIFTHVSWVQIKRGIWGISKDGHPRRTYEGHTKEDIWRETSEKRNPRRTSEKDIRERHPWRTSERHQKEDIWRRTSKKRHPRRTSEKDIRTTSNRIQWKSESWVIAERILNNAWLFRQEILLLEYNAWFFVGRDTLRMRNAIMWNSSCSLVFHVLSLVVYQLFTCERRL